MIHRQLAVSLIQISEQVPVVTLLGPRQSGKTTLVKKLFSNYTYVNLEDPLARQLAQDDYRGFFETYPEPMIIDEVQRVPELLSVIQVRVDEERSKNGRFILTGSHQPSLQKGIAQSLAGRTSILQLLPLSMSELNKENILQEYSLDELLLRGMMPELYRQGVRKPGVYYRDYLNTYVERDLREMLEVRNLDSFLRFLRLLSGRVGQLVNLSSMSGEVGVSSTTLAEWLSVLEASFVVFKLQPYFSNINKRQIKSPKIYFTEVGLASYLLGLETENQVNRDPLRGNLFENLVVSEALKARLNQNEDPNLYFLRTSGGVEVDLILQKKGSLYPFEIKSAMTPNKSYNRHLKVFCEAESKVKNPTVIYAGEPFPSFGDVRYIRYDQINALM